MQEPLPGTEANNQSAAATGVLEAVFLEQVACLLDVIQLFPGSSSAPRVPRENIVLVEAMRLSAQRCR